MFTSITFKMSTRPKKLRQKTAYMYDYNQTEVWTQLKKMASLRIKGKILSFESTQIWLNRSIPTGLYLLIKNGVPATSWENSGSIPSSFSTVSLQISCLQTNTLKLQ